MAEAGAVRGARVGPEARLVARDALGDARSRTTLEALGALALVALAVPHEPERRAALDARLARALGSALPAVGEAPLAADGHRLLALQPDKLFVLFDEADAFDPRGALDAEAALAARLGRGDEGGAVAAGTAPQAPAGATDAAVPIALSDQSDAWAMLRLAGEGARRALERLCPLDLHPDVFAVDTVARTAFEHLSAIVLREGEDSFLLLSPRSSAADFAHELERAIASARDGGGGAPVRDG